MSELGNFMAAIRSVESGSEKGDYNARQGPVNGVRASGAYGFTNFANQATTVGLPQSRMEDSLAQDRVAALLFKRLHRKYNSWDLVALAWFSGEKQADAVAEAGFTSTDQLGSTQVKAYMTAVSNAFAQADGYEAPLEAEDDPVETIVPREEVKKPQASAMMSQFVDQMSNANAGGQRANIDDIAPKVVVTPAEEEPIVVEEEPSGIRSQEG